MLKTNISFSLRRVLAGILTAASLAKFFDRVIVLDKDDIEPRLQSTTVRSDQEAHAALQEVKCLYFTANWDAVTVLRKAAPPKLKAQLALLARSQSRCCISVMHDV